MIAAAAVASFVTGDWVWGIFSVLALVLAIVPTLAARRAHVGWPIELELILLWLLATHVVLGDGFHLYGRIAWFDKALHLTNSILIGFVAFLAVYTTHFVAGTRAHPMLDALAILIVTLGLGALWEIGEFVADSWFGGHSQGSPTMSPLDDTMWDLILDGAGGIIAAIAGPIYMHRSRRSRRRMAEIAAHVAERRLRAPSPRARASAARAARSSWPR